jgi:ATP-dependent Lon protease
MQESMNVAKTLAISLIENTDLDSILKDAKETLMQGIHIHCPEGATPKDGPSAGTAITCAIYSVLTNKKILKNVAITGEINLQGNVTEIGGLSQKIIGGIKGGVTTFLFPQDNMKDFKEFKEKCSKVYSSRLESNYIDIENIRFVPVQHISDVLEIIFTS